MKIVATTERLVLRYAESGNAGFMFRLMNDPGWLANIGDRGIRTEEDARAYLMGYRAGYALNGWGMYIVTERESGTAVGVCGLLKRPWMDDVEIGFAVLPAFRGAGYAFEAARAAMDLGIGGYGMTRIAATVLPTNAVSLRVLEKLGLRPIGNVTSPDTGVELLHYEWESDSALA